MTQVMLINLQIQLLSINANWSYSTGAFFFLIVLIQNWHFAFCRRPNLVKEFYKGMFVWEGEGNKQTVTTGTSSAV